MVASLGPQLRVAITTFFATGLKDTAVQSIVHFLDQRFSFLTDGEDRRIFEAFKNMTRQSSESLQAFLIRWKATLERALSTGFRPGSDLSEVLLLASSAVA